MGKSDDYPQGQAEPEVLFAALAGGAGFGENVGVGVVFEPGTTAHAGDRVAVGAAAYAHGRALGQLLGHMHLHVRLPSGPSRTPRIFAPRAKLRRAPWHLGFAPCNAAQRRHHLRRMSMHRTRDRALRREASRAGNLLDLAAPVL